MRCIIYAASENILFIPIICHDVNLPTLDETCLILSVKNVFYSKSKDELKVIDL